MSAELLHAYVTEMRVANYSPVTIGDRVELLGRLARHIGKPLIEATADDLAAFQAAFVHLAPATVNIYSRHVKAFFDWATKRGHLERSPADELVIPRVNRGRPHPTTDEDLQTVFACTRGPLRVAYTLAAFAGLRRAEICRLHRRDLDLSSPAATALVQGKGRKERIVPLLPPVVAELAQTPSGWLVAHEDGRPYLPDRLSTESGRHMQRIGVQTTLHSMRHFFATCAAKTTKDPLFVRDLLGHESVGTAEIYMKSDMERAQERLEGLASQAAGFLGDRRLYVARGA